MLIRIENLVHTYAPGMPLARTALRGVSLEISPGERVGIVGHTGSGKSTLVQHLAGLLTPTSGRVWLDGIPAHERTAAARAQRRRVGLAFQYPEDQIFEQTVFREVAFGPRNLGLKEPEITTRVRWALEMVGLNPAEMQNRIPFTLSGGEMRRVALAGILALRPEVLILDEPTAGLDVSVQGEILNLMAELQREHGLSYLIITHNLPVVRHIADRLAIMYLGRLVEYGNCELLFDQPAHPYTEALVKGMPRPDPDKRRSLISIAGEVPSLANRPPGCEFHTRCSYAQPQCQIDLPEMLPLPDGRFVRCHLRH